MPYFYAAVGYVWAIIIWGTFGEDVARWVEVLPLAIILASLFIDVRKIIRRKKAA